jgi:ATP-dependent Clp protease ATP-binding subunit ClpX
MSLRYNDMPALRCSFCDRPVNQVERLITGPNKNHPVHVCNECVGVCVEILRGGSETVDAGKRFRQRRRTLLERLLKTK